jgi:outer membrane receptor for ferrienterochelin and colicin
MRRFSIFAVVIGCLLITAPLLHAQSSNGVITGRVTYEGGPMPGVTITAASDAVQGGSQTVVTGVDGSYIFRFLPAGTYTVSFVLDSFQTLESTVKVSAASSKTIDAVMVPESVSEEIVVTSNYETVSSGSQASSTVEQDVLEKLPVARNLISAVNLTAGVAATGPSDNITIAGSMSFENLFTMNGVVMNENLRGQPFDMFIEDAIQETTVITSGISAEYGRFGGGVVNMITKSGGNEFSGSYRLNLTNDDWVSKTPVTDAQVDELNRIHEATFGGYLWRDRLWFFLAGRDMSTSASNETYITDIPYVSDNTELRLEAKLTFSPNSSHRIIASYMEIDEDQTNNALISPMNLGTLDASRSLPLDSLALNYTGVITDNFFIEALYSERNFTFAESGGETTDYGLGTPIWDLYWGGMYHAPLFCGAPECTEEERNNDNLQLKGSYFLASESMGTHDIIFGYDTFSDIRISDNWQSGSGYIFAPWYPSIIDGQDVTAMAVPFGAYIIWGSVLLPSEGTDFETSSLFVNDTWRLNDKITIGLGLRYDKNDGTDAGGLKTVDDSRISPRVSLSWDLFGDGEWIVNASLARYVAAIANTQADAGAAGGQPTWAGYIYNGPAVNTDCVPSDPSTICYTNQELLDIVFDWWFNEYGGPTNGALRTWADIPGMSPVIDETLASPYTDEFSVGVTKRLGNRGMVRADYVHREYGDFYATYIDQTTGTVSNEIAGTLDLGVLRNENDILVRNYDALMTRFDYRFTDYLSVGGNWTWSHARGNFEGETGGSGPVAGQIHEYPEYKDPAWNMPEGDLDIDQRHKVRLYAIWDVFSTDRHNLSVSLLQNYWSGTPYDATGAVDPFPNGGDDFGYVGPPNTVTYYFSGKGEYNWDDITRTDIAVNYSFFIGPVELYIQPEVLNVLNEDGAVGGNTSMFTHDNSDLATFDPFTETPVEGVHYEYGDGFGDQLLENHYQLPRTFRLSLGIRF